MNYRHAYHAGNFADVVKHLALVSILLRLKRKPSPFAVVDSHAGRGLYELDSEEARRSGEAERGIGRLRDLSGGPETLDTYLSLVRDCGRGRYPGSPLLAARLLRPADRLVAIEKQPEEARALRAALAAFPRARVEEADGHARLLALMPPPERRGLALIDPPFEEPDEFSRLAETLAGAVRRFATGIIMAWFPVKSAAAAGAFCGEALAAGPRRLLRIDVRVEAEAGTLGAAGLLVVNAPFGFVDDMRKTLSFVAPKLGGAAPAAFDIRLLAGEA